MNPNHPSNPSSTTEGKPSSSTLEKSASTVGQTTRDATNKVKSAASSTVSRAKEEGGRLAHEKKQEAAEKIGSYSSAIHESARAFEEKDPNIAWFTHRAADRLQGVANYMRDRDFSGLRRDSEELARRHPVSFFGGLFVAGLVLGNLVKASQRQAMDRESRSSSESSSNWMKRPEPVGNQPELPMSPSPMPSTSGGI
jgi:hypothetical protein